MMAISPLWRREIASFDDTGLWSHARRGSPALLAAFRRDCHFAAVITATPFVIDRTFIL